MQKTVTPEHIDNLIKASGVEVQKVGPKTTVVQLTLPNGFSITESAACVSPDNYDEVVGTQICLEKIKSKVWELEGYRLQQELCLLAEPSADYYTEVEYFDPSRDKTIPRPLSYAHHVLCKPQASTDITLDAGLDYPFLPSFLLHLFQAGQRDNRIAINFVADCATITRYLTVHEEGDGTKVADIRVTAVRDTRERTAAVRVEDEIASVMASDKISDVMDEIEARVKSDDQP